MIYNDNLNLEILDIVSLKLAKKLKKEGFSLPTKYFYQDKNILYSSKGLKHMKNNKKLNHNKYDNFIYSAPDNITAIRFLRKINNC